MRAFRAFEVETIAYLVSKLWQLLPHDVNQQNTIQILKKELDIGFAINENVEYAKTFFHRGWISNRASVVKLAINLIFIFLFFEISIVLLQPIYLNQLILSFKFA